MTKMFEKIQQSERSTAAATEQKYNRVVTERIDTLESKIARLFQEQGKFTAKTTNNEGISF